MSHVSIPVNLSPKVAFVKKRYEQMMTLAAEKVTRHLQNPGQYPLPAAGKKSVERALYDVIMELPRRKRDDFTNKFDKIPAPGTDQRKQQLGDLHEIDLQSTTPVAEQVKKIAVPEHMQFAPQEIAQLEKILPAHAKPAGLRRRPTPRQAVATRLDFFVDSITCNETNDMRKDEINLGGFATDAAGAEFTKDPFFVSKFKKGDTVPLGAKGNLFHFSLDTGSTGGTFPLTFVSGIFINEEDLISNKDLARKLSILLVSAGLAIMVAGLLVMVLVPPVFWIGMSIYVVGALSFLTGKDFIPFYLTDDLGIPVADTLVLDTPPVPGQVFTRTINLPIELRPGFIQNSYTASVRWVAS